MLVSKQVSGTVLVHGICDVHHSMLLQTKLYQGNKAVCLLYNIPGSREYTQNMVVSMMLQALKHRVSS